MTACLSPSVRPATPADAPCRPPCTAAAHARLLLQVPLAGFAHHAGEHVWPLLGIGSELRLLREAAHPHDHHAVAVWFGHHRIGYLPRPDNRTVAERLDRGERLSAYVVTLRPRGNPWQRLRLAVEWWG
ncbi:HIRAN domain-containing protein [Plasticicumulans lactativorans]|uniref:HIRAN domain-containing protein n=1 Tax=Plasticicumulans lactativorans TaxID=1133106 RepID=A0A4R2L4E6_9GAMM|nr:HIRAN domain-containing protein [Plasticicumulans lactativorans]TCO78839.1 HIRAN domain-containing protein [Plasticicumulans lactativorans]